MAERMLINRPISKKSHFTAFVDICLLKKIARFQGIYKWLEIHEVDCPVLIAVS